MAEALAGELVAPWWSATGDLGRKRMRLKRGSSRGIGPTDGSQGCAMDGKQGGVVHRAFTESQHWRTRDSAKSLNGPIPDVMQKR